MSMLAESRESLGDMADTLIAQQGIAAARAEYEQLGVDMDAMQMDYLFFTGAKMLMLSALGMVVAIAIGFLASRTAAKVGRSLRGRLFDKVVTFSDAEIQSFSAASLITRGTNDVQQVQMVTVMLLRMVLYAPILAIGGIIMIARTNLSMADRHRRRARNRAHPCGAHQGRHAEVQDYAEADRPREPCIARDAHGPFCREGVQPRAA